MTFNAASAYLDIRKQYLENIIELATGQFPNDGEEARWEAIRKQLRRDWASDDPATALFARPVLEPLFRYPSCGKTVDELIDEGILDRRMKGFVSEGLLKGSANGGYDLYRHQLESIKKSKTKSIVVSSGTGSGKTECFLYSMINNLLAKAACGKDDLTKPGVRILLIYPMNALVKDQLKRIYELVCRTEKPCLRVGMYTSQTPDEGNGEDQPWAVRGCQDANDRNIKLNHLVWSRKALRDKDRIPHILITNYSMMEYMMLREADRDIFETGRLSAIVLDEAHLYSGSLGNDINMLLRRVLARFGTKHRDIRFYATSATIGDGHSETLQEAAAGLFGIPEGYVEPISGKREYYPSDRISWSGSDVTDKDRSNAVTLKQKVLAWNDPEGFYPLSNADLELLARIPPDGKDEQARDFLPFKIHTFIDSPNRFYSDMAIDDDEHPLGHIRRLATSEDGRNGLLVFSSNNLRKEIYFGAQMAQVKPQEENDERDEEYSYVLFGPDVEWENKNLNPVYFRFHSSLDDDSIFRFRLEEVPAQNGMPAGWRLVKDNAGRFVFALPADENKGLLSDSQVPQCAYGHTESTWRAANGDPLREFAGIDSMTRDADEDSDDADNAAATSRYSNRGMMVPLGFVSKSLRSTLLAELVFPHLPDPVELENDQKKENLPWNGRQLLFFSDSRCGSAEMAVTLQNTHRERFVSACIYRWLAAKEEEDKRPRSLDDISKGMAEETGFLPQIPLPQWSYDRFEKEKRPVSVDEIKKYYLVPSLVFGSIATWRTGERSLEGVGAIRASINRRYLPTDEKYEERNNNNWNRVLEKCLGNNSEEQKMDWEKRALPALVNLLRGSRKVFFKPFWEEREEAEKEDAQGRRRNWPARNRFSIVENGLGYLASDLRKGMFCTKEQFKRRLKKNLEGPTPIFSQFKDNADRKDFPEIVFNLLNELAVSPDNAEGEKPLFVKGKNKKSENDDDAADDGGSGIAVNAAALQFETVADRIFADKKTNKAVCGIPGKENDVRDVTENVHNSVGYKTLVRDGGEDLFHWDEEYGVKFDSSSFGGLRVPEHSAQLQTENLGKVEEGFRRHEVNIFSCTPTLEVGVDIGGMCAVIQANLPPEKANYLQRAGRAGRRDAKSAFVLTFLGHGLQDSEVIRDSLSFFRRSNPFSVANVTVKSAENQVRSHLWQFLIGVFFQSLGKGSGQGENQSLGVSNSPMAAWEIAGCFLGRKEILKKYQEYLEKACELSDEGRWKKTAQKELQQVSSAEKLIGQSTTAKCSEMKGYLDEHKEEFEDDYLQILEGTICEKTIQTNWLLNILDPLDKKLQGISNSFNESLLNIVHKLDDLTSKTDDMSRRMSIALRHQFIAKFREQLIQCLVHERILPPYGFPVDVIPLTGEGLDFQRPISSAIREFTPESRITVGHRKYSIDALSPSRYEVNGDAFQPLYIARCKHCGFVETKERLQDKAECPRCHIPEGIRVRWFVTPVGFQSVYSPRDAASTNSGRFFSETEEDLLIDEQIQTDFIPADSENSAEILYLNKGRFGKGYLVDTATNFAISCPRGEEQDWRKDSRVKNWLDKHPHRISGHPDFACKAKVAVWICTIPGNCGGLDSNEHLQTLFGLALRMEAMLQLHLDSRVINVKVKRDKQGSIKFCLYETSGASSVMAEVSEKGKAILRGALERLKKSKEYEGRVDNLLSYATDRDLSKIPEAAFADAAKWATDHETELVERKPCKLKKSDGTEIEISDPQDGRDRLLVTDTGKPLTILCKSVDPAWGEPDTLLAKFVKRHKNSSIRIVFGKLDESMPVLARKMLRKQLADYAAGLAIGRGCFSFHEVDFSASKWGRLYDLGYRLISGGEWILTSDETDVDVISAMASNDVRRRFESSLYAASGDSVPTMPDLLGTEVVSMPIEIPESHKPAHFEKGAAFDPKEFWERIGINPVQVQLVSLSINDPYFLSPKAWRMIDALIAAIERHAGAILEVNTWDPESHVQDVAGPRWFRMPSWGGHGSSPRDVKCGQRIDLPLQEEDARSFADCLKNRLGLVSASVTYLPQKPDHDRWMDFTFDIDGRRETGKIWVGKGFDLLSFPDEPKLKLFDPQAIREAVYADTANVFRE